MKVAMKFAKFGALVVGACAVFPGGLRADEPGLVRFVYAMDTFRMLFHTDVWTANGQNMTTPDVTPPVISGWNNSNVRSMVLQGLLDVPEDGDYLFRSVNREEIVVAGCRRLLIGPDADRVVHLTKGKHPFRRIYAPRQVVYSRPGWRENGKGLEWKRVSDDDYQVIQPASYSHTDEDFTPPDLFRTDLPLTLRPERGGWLSWDVDVPETGFYVLNIRQDGQLRYSAPSSTVGFWLDGRHLRHYYELKEVGGILDEEPLPLWLEKGRHRLDARGSRVELYLQQEPRLWFRSLASADAAPETLVVEMEKTPGESVFRMGEAIEWTIQRSTLDCAEPLKLRFEAVRQRTDEIVFATDVELPPGQVRATATVAFPTDLSGAFEYAVKDMSGRELEGPWQFLVIDTGRKANPAFAARAAAGDTFDDPATFGVKVDEIDFGTEGLGCAHRIRDNGTSRVVDAGAVRYRQTGPKRKGAVDPKNNKNIASVDWFGYTLAVRHPGVAHLAVFELPNDRFRRFPVQLIDPQTGHSNGGYYEIPQAAKPGTVRMIVPFWPNEPTIDGLMMPSDTHNDPRSTPGALARVTLYECPDGFPDLPAAKAGWNPDRLAGWSGEQGDLSPERTTTPPIRPDGQKVPMVKTDNTSLYYDYTAYGLAWQRYGEYSAWQGHNYLSWPIHSYDLAHVQTERLPWGSSLFAGNDSSFRRDKYRRNTLKIILLNCEKYGVRFYGDLQVNNNVGRELAQGKTLAEVAAAEDANRPLLNALIRAEGITDLSELEGAFLLEHNDLGGNLNPAHPLARRYYANFFGEIAALCRDLPAFAGMTIRHWTACSSAYGAWWCDARSGYDDWTLRRYREETGEDVPLGETDKVKREEFLLNDLGRREKWFRWRADKVTSLKREILASMRRYRPDAKLQVEVEGRPCVEFGKGLDETVPDKDLGLSLRVASIRRQGNECGTLDPVDLANFDVREGVDYVAPEDKYGGKSIYPAGLHCGSAMFAPPYATKGWCEKMSEGAVDMAAEGTYWALPVGCAQVREWIRAFRALPNGEYVRVAAPVADPDVVCWKSGQLAYFVGLRPYDVTVAPSSSGVDLVTGERFGGKLTVGPYGLRVVRTDEELTDYLIPLSGERLVLRVQNPSGARRDNEVVTFPLDGVRQTGGDLANLRLFRQGVEVPLQLDGEPFDEGAFLCDFRDGEKEIRFDLRFDRGPRPAFTVPFATEEEDVVKSANNVLSTTHVVRVSWSGHTVALRGAGIGLIAEGEHQLFTGRRSAGNTGWSLFGMPWKDAAGQSYPTPQPRILSSGPVRMLVGYAYPDEATHWEIPTRAVYLYPSLYDARASRHYQFRAGGDTVEIVNRYRYAHAVGSTIEAKLGQEGSWLEPVTPMDPKVVYCTLDDGTPGESYWSAEKDTFAPKNGGTWMALVDRSVGCGWGLALDPTYVANGGLDFGKFFAARQANANVPEYGGFDMTAQLRLFPSDPGAEKAASLAAAAFAEPPVAVVEAYVPPAPGHYADAVNGDDDYDGSSPFAEGDGIGPKRTLAAANELLTANGDVLMIAPGEYRLEAEIANAKQVTYRGIDPDGDATKVVINGQGKCRGFNLSENSRIEGLTISNCYNDVDNYGGGVRFWYLGTITNCVIVGCTNAYAKASPDGKLSGGAGGGVCFSNDRAGSRYVQDCRFLLNRAISYGGGLYHRGGTGTYLYVRGCHFEGNVGSSGGGSFSERDNKYVEYRDCTFVGNYGTGEAGALSKQVSLVSNCVFRANWSKGSGGVYAHGDYSGAKPFYDCLFEDNRTTNDVGGAIALSRAGMATFSRCRFYRNKSKGRGSAIWASSANAEQCKLIDCDFTGNANDDGHTAFPQPVVAGQPQLVSGCFFTNNLGIVLSSSSDAIDWIANGYPRPVVTNCVFADNGAWNLRDSNQTVCRGGAICWGSYGAFGPAGTRCPLVTHCQFCRNSVTNAAVLKGTGNGADGGGAIFAPLDIRIEDCHFEGNKVGYGLGGAFCGDATGGIFRCSFVGNSVVSNSIGVGSAIDFNMSPVKELTNRVYNVVEDCVFTNNSSAKVGAYSASPVISVGRGNLRVARCDFYANTNTTTMTYGTHYPACIAFYTHFTMISSQSDKEEVDGNKFPRYLACENCRFEKNYGTGTGVCLSLYENHSTVPGVPNTRGYVRNCLFKDNVVSVGKIGAVAMKGCGSAIVVGLAPVTVDNCTFVGNYADAALASQKATTGAFHGTGTNAVVRNCVFYDNKDLTKKGDISCANADQLNAFSNCFETTGGPLTDGVNGCIVKDENPFRADDHTNLAVKKDCGSAAGLPLDWMTDDSLDLGDKPRLAADGTVDFGCYQLWFKPGFLLFVR